MTDGESRVDMQ